MKKRTVKTTTTVTTETIDEGTRPTLITFLLDRTGSMQQIKADTIGGFNAYLDTLEREAGDLVEFTWLQFDSVSIDKLCVGAKLKDVPRLTMETYVPRANTPLYDAAVKTIKAAEEALIRRQREAASLTPRMIVVIQTDGEENASREYTERDLQDLIKRRTAEGWEFLYLGANIDAYKTASRLGVSTSNTVSYNGAASMRMFAMTASNNASVARGLSGSSAYSARQKASVGDTHGLGGTSLGGTSLGTQGTGLDASAGLVGAAGPLTPSKLTPIVDDINL